MRVGMPLSHSVGSAGTAAVRGEGVSGRAYRAPLGRTRAVAPGGAQAASGVVLADGTSRRDLVPGPDEAAAAPPEDLVRGVPLVDLAS